MNCKFDYFTSSYAASQFPQTLEFCCSKYKAATQDDLWNQLTLQAHKDGTLDKDLTVKMVMDTWTLQMGFPVVNVERKYDRGTAVLTQVLAFMILLENIPLNNIVFRKGF